MGATMTTVDEARAALMLACDLREGYGEKADALIAAVRAEGHREAARYEDMLDDAEAKLAALREAAQDVVDRSPIDQDGETLDTWCHYCESMRDDHDVNCSWELLRAALAATPDEAQMVRVPDLISWFR